MAMGTSFIENLLSNVNNEDALSRSLEELIEANKTAYREAIDNLENHQAHLPLDEEYQLPADRLDVLLRHIS
jgi:hypothetical protein